VNVGFLGHKMAHGKVPDQEPRLSAVSFRRCIMNIHLQSTPCIDAGEKGKSAPQMKRAQTGVDGRAYVSSPCKPSVLCCQTTRASLSVDNHNHSHRFEHLKSHEMGVVCVALATAYGPNISDLNQRVLERKL